MGEKSANLYSSLPERAYWLVSITTTSPVVFPMLYFMQIQVRAEALRGMPVFTNWNIFSTRHIFIGSYSTDCLGLKRTVVLSDPYGSLTCSEEILLSICLYSFI